ncbi:MAG TPA: protein kinase, partial [Archangium sp.]|nr:protein kinase [Archangium sp.]
MVTYLVEKTEGIPLFVEELTRALFERTPASGEVSAEVPLPVTLHELLLARLDPLPPEQKELAWMGSVFGRSFTRAQLAALSPRDDTLLRRDLEELVAAGVLRPSGAGREPRYEFRHALIQDAAYQSLLRTQRRQYHRRIAELLATPPPGVEGAPPELVAHHHAQAGAVEPALSWWMQAGALAMRRSAHVDAVTHYTRALRLLQKLPEGPERDRQELALQLALGAPLMSTRGYAAPEVRETYARALELSRRMGDDAQLFPSVLGLWQFYMVGGEARVSAELGRQLLAQAERTQEPVMLMLAYRALGTSLMLLGELVACREHMERGLLLYDREKHGMLALRFGQDPGVTNGLYLSWSLWFLGHVDQSVVAARKALALARSLEHPLSIAFALNYLAAVHNYRGEHATAQALAEEAGVISSEHRLALWLAMSKIQRGWAALATAPGEGVALLEEGISGWQQTGAGSGLTYFLYVLGWGQRRAGQLHAAMKTLERAEAIMRTQGERFYEAGLWCLRGELTQASGTGHEALAEECFRRGLEVARQQRTKSWEL